MAVGSFGSVTVFGGATADRIAATRAAPVMGASNPGTMRSTAGGVGFNVACVLARLGHPARLVTCLGDDEAGRAVLAAAKAAGVDTGRVAVTAARPTATYNAILDDRGGLIIGIADMEVLSGITPPAIAPAVAEAPADDLWVIDANLPPETIDFLAGEATATNRSLVGLPVSPAKALRLVPILDRIALLFANRAEAAVLLERDQGEGQASAAFLADSLSRRGSLDAVVTDAGGLLVAASGGRTRAFAPLRAEVRSVNGAGDAFAAGTIHGLAGGRGLFEAILSGLAAAAITLESDATLPDELTPALVAARIGAERIPT